METTFSQNSRRIPVSFKLLTWLTILAQALAPYQSPFVAQAATIEPAPTAPQQPAFQPNHVGPKVERPSPVPRFSNPPTDNEIFRAHIFAEPLIPSGQTDPAENRALVKALLSFRERSDQDDFSAITDFLETHPASPWRFSLLTDLGIYCRHTGWFLKALDCWEEAWKLGKNETRMELRRVADCAVSELAELNARLGRFDRLDALFQEIEGRDFHGPATVKIESAKCANDHIVREN